MSRTRLWLLGLLAVLASPASAQIGGTPIELSGQAGIYRPDARAHMKLAPALEATLGYRFQSWIALEGYALVAPSKTDVPPERTFRFGTAGLDLRLNMRPGDGRVVPYVLGGFGYGRSSVAGTRTERGAGSLGLGAMFNVMGPRTYLRIEGRDVFFREHASKEFGQNLAMTAGLHYVWRGKAKDADLDGVRDWLDECAGTPIGATVDAKGCPKDSDGDGVLDGIDQCPDTPKGATVDAKGCPRDSDGDGVLDGIDQCADTPKGATVDAKGCPSDGDGDSVLDGIDQCPGTAKGCTVDEKGCPKDSDGDSVCDGLDQCPDTQAGLKVDAQGCPIEVIEKETELLDTGMIRLQNVNFETDKTDLLAESLPVLDVVGAVLSKWPELKIEIGGHTDARGSNVHNQKLSEGRAESVRTYLVGKYPAMQAEQYTVKGYGESRPLVPNTSELNMAKNRRVEFVVKNPSVLKHEVERRQLLKKEQAPPPSPAPSDTLRLVPAQPDTTR